MLFLRPDVEWLHTHPPLSFFSRDYCWFPSNRGWGGFQHTAVLCPRELAHHFALKWSTILNGTLISRLKDRRWKCTKGVNCNAETLTMNSLGAAGVKGKVYTAGKVE